jgi:hypothetical protein
MHNQTLPLAITPKYVEHLPDEVLIFDGQRLLCSLHGLQDLVRVPGLRRQDHHR